MSPSEGGRGNTNPYWRQCAPLLLITSSLIRIQVFQTIGCRAIETWIWFYWNCPGLFNTIMTSSTAWKNWRSMFHLQCFSLWAHHFWTLCKKRFPNVIEHVEKLYFWGLNYSTEPFTQKRKPALAFRYNLARTGTGIWALARAGVVDSGVHPSPSLKL